MIRPTIRGIRWLNQGAALGAEVLLRVPPENKYKTITIWAIEGEPEASIRKQLAEALSVDPASIVWLPHVGKKPMETPKV